ncbi:unannotated protein [freshwater metagenome]|uniref:Unannotated protein n=1 Tax=freshwater metagenome TaxID=449393 RepID=A0A6J7XS80_9ZZZZ|nr:amidase [Actinomycetota bacterium]
MTHVNPYTSAQDLIEHIRTGVTSPIELLENSLERISHVDSSGYALNSVLALDLAARDFALGVNSGLPLAGIPVLIKDNIEAIGLPATAGSAALAPFPVLRDSSIVARLRAAGANVIGATNLSEWANIRSTQSTSGWSAVGGLTANPWSHERSAGGSSSGSGAAIAAGLVPLAVGSETDGSIICPASLNGCVGIKPTVGTVPRDGVIPISASQDSPGSMARTVEDAALLLEVMMGTNGLVQAAREDRQIRIGVVSSWLTSDEGTDSLFSDALTILNSSGITLVEIDIAQPEDWVAQDEFAILLHELVDDLAAYLSLRTNGSFNSLKQIMEFNLQNPEIEMQHFKHELFDQAIALGGRGEKYAQLRKKNVDWAQGILSKGLENVDVLIGASYSPAWKSTLGGGDDFSKASWITMAPAIAGTPIGCVPMGVTQGLPVGLGVVARKNDEATLISAMARIEKSLDLGILVPTYTK